MIRHLLNFKSIFFQTSFNMKKKCFFFTRQLSNFIFVEFWIVTNKTAFFEFVPCSCEVSFRITDDKLNLDKK
jgi:hypothetical protein